MSSGLSLDETARLREAADEANEENDGHPYDYRAPFSYADAARLLDAAEALAMLREMVGTCPVTVGLGTQESSDYWAQDARSQESYGDDLPAAIRAAYERAGGGA